MIGALNATVEIPKILTGLLKKALIVWARIHKGLVSEYLPSKQQGLCAREKKKKICTTVCYLSKSVIAITIIMMMECSNSYIIVIITVITIIELFCFIVAISPIPLQQITEWLRLIVSLSTWLLW